MLQLLPALAGLLLPVAVHPGTPGQEPADASLEAAALSVVPQGYADPAELTQRLHELSQSGHCVLLPLTSTPASGAVLAAGFGATGEPGRPSVLVLADPDGDRPVGSQVAWALCEHLAAGGSPLLDAASVWVIVVANPDAAALAFNGRSARRGAPVDEDRDGRLDEDPPDDLDGDGRVLQMRVRDATGAWRVDETDARAVIEADRERGESGGWRLLAEGHDDDGDRKINEDDVGGTSLEANWPHRWQQHAVDAGLYPLSELESRGIATFVLDHPELALVIVLGAEDNLVSPPKGIERPDSKSKEPLEADARLLKQLGERLFAGVEEKPRGGAERAGSFAEWAYFQAGILTLESAVWSPPLDHEPEAEPAAEEGTDDAEEASEATQEKPGRTGAKPKQVAEEIKLLRWNDQVLGGGGFSDWRPFEHPDLGSVEIGGWLPLVLHNPPAEELPGIQQQWIRFLDSLAEDFARLEWQEVEVRELADGVFEARATLVNPSRLPTATAMGKITRRPLPLRVTLELPDSGTLLVGRTPDLVDRLEGLGGHQEFRWVYRLPAGSTPARVRAWSQTARVTELSLEVNR